MPWLQILLRAAVYFAASITVDQTFGISTALAQYFGPFPSYDYAAGYTPSSSEPVTVTIPIKLKDTYELYTTTVLESQVRDINSSNRSESGSGVLAAEVVNILGVPHEIQLTANASHVREFARNVSMADSESTKAACLVPSHRWSWLYNLMGHHPLSKTFRAFVMFLLCHDYVMNRAYVAFPTMTLVGGAMFYGWHFRVKTLRNIVRMSKKLATAEDLTVNLMNNVTSAEARALEAEETKGQLQQQYSEAVILKDILKGEADAARGEADTARKAQEQAEKARKDSIEAEKTASAALALANDEKNRLNVVSNTQEAALDKIRQENSELRDHDLSLRNEVDRITIASTTAAKRSQKKSMQEIESLKQAKKDKDEKLKSQNQTTLKLRDDVKSLKEQLKQLSPDGVEKLKKQLMAEEEARAAAEKKTRHLEAEISKVEKERKTWAGEVGELKKKMEEAEESRRAAEDSVALLEAEKAQQAEVEAQAKNDLMAQVEEAARSQKAAEDKIRGLEAEMAHQAEKWEEAKRDLLKRVEEAVACQNAAEEKAAVLEAEMAQAREQAKTQVEEAVSCQKTAEEQCALSKAEMVRQAGAEADAMRQMEEKLDASTRLLVAVKSEMEELDMNSRQIVVHSVEVQAAKDETIRALEAQIKGLTSGSSATDDEVSTSSQGLDEPPQRPAVKIPAASSESATTDDADMNDHDAGFSIKGAAGRRNNGEISNSGAENDGSNVSPSFPKPLSGTSKRLPCDNCHNRHEGPCLACSRCRKIHEGACRPRPMCFTCGKIHRGVCRLDLANNEVPTHFDSPDILDESTPSSASDATDAGPAPRAVSSDGNSPPAGFAARGRGVFPRAGGRARGNNFRGAPFGTRGGRPGPRPERIDPAQSFRRQREGRRKWQG